MACAMVLAYLSSHHHIRVLSYNAVDTSAIPSVATYVDADADLEESQSVVSPYNAAPPVSSSDSSLTNYERKGPTCLYQL